MKLLKKTKIVLPIALIVIICLSLFVYQVGFYGGYLNLVEKYSKEYRLDKNLVLAIIRTESNFNKNAKSKKGAVGLMQVMPSTALYLSEIYSLDDDFNLFNEETNIKFGTLYLKYLFEKFSSESVVICAYNAGESEVLNWIDGNGKLIKIKYSQTKNYLGKVQYKKQLYKIILS